MITKIRNNKCLAVAIAFTAALLIGCDDDPGVENYYTAKGDMANTYLTSRPETFSKFVDIINKSKLVNLDLLGTYGSYTVFAPTNEAVDAYLAGRQMSSVDDLSVADCDTIAPVRTSLNSRTSLQTSLMQHFRLRICWTVI